MTRMEKVEACLRFSVLVLLILTALLVALDTQTKAIFFTLEKKATYKDLHILLVLVRVDYAVAAYNLLQLSRCLIYGRSKWNSLRSYAYVAWTNFLLDQIAVYIAFSANSAAFEASILAVTGADSFQWMKLCDKFSRFCSQIGGALFCGYIASLLMIARSSISAFNLFRLYSPKQFLLLKSTK